MVRLTTLVIAAGALALACASGAVANITYDSTTATVFVGRGDVISRVGKSGLVDHPTGSWRFLQTWTTTCTFADAYVMQVPSERWITLRFDYVPRYARGSGVITGYSQSMANAVPDGGVWDIRACQWSAASHGGLVGTTAGPMTTTNTLYFQGVALPAPPFPLA